MRDFGRVKDSYDFSLDSRQLGLVILAVIAFAALVFVLGVSVGRQWERKASGKGGAQAVEASLEEPEPGRAVMPVAPPVAPPVDLPDEEKAGGLKGGGGDDAAGKPGGIAEGELTFPKVLTSNAKGTTPLKAPSARREKTAGPAVPGGAAGTYTVQVGAYKDKSAAKTIVERLGSKGFDARLVPVKAGDGTYIYKVRVGGYPTRASAEKTASRLAKSEGGKPFVMVEK